MARKRPSGSLDRGRSALDQFNHLVSPLGLDGAQTPQYSPDECVEVDQAKGQSNQRRRGPHEAGEYRRNERRGG
jgi:hypothetical protein